MNRTESWAVTVERNGEPVVTLASNCLSGRDLSAEDERVIRMAAEHLLSFIGAMPSSAPAPVSTPQGRITTGDVIEAAAALEAELREHFPTLPRASFSLRDVMEKHLRKFALKGSLSLPAPEIKESK